MSYTLGYVKLFPFTWLDPVQDVFLLKIVSNVRKIDFYVKIITNNTERNGQPHNWFITNLPTA